MSRILKSKLIVCLLFGFTGVLGKGLLDDKSTSKDTTLISFAENKANTNNVDEKQIYGTFEKEFSWVSDPKEPKNLLALGENSIVKVRVTSIGDAIFLDKTSNFYDPEPVTPIEVTVEETLNGKNRRYKDSIFKRWRGYNLQFYEGSRPRNY